MLRKWKLNDKWVVRDISFEVIALLIVEKQIMTFSWDFWFSNGWLQTNVIFEADWCIILIIRPPPLICWVSYGWPVGCVKEEETDISIAKPRIYKAAGSGIMKWYFQASVGYTCCLLFINQSSTNSLRSVPQVYQFIFLHTKNF